MTRGSRRPGNCWRGYPPGDHERLAASGILSFQAALTKFLATEKARISLQNVAGHARSAGAAALCLRHVALVLNARPAPGRGQAMVLALAGALRRAAEDMRAYSLKREARHSGLVTDDESRAHCDALRLLAGQQALARPWDGGPATGSKEA